MSTTFHTPINNISTTVGTAYTAGSHSLVLATGTGSQFGSTFPLIITASRSGSVLSILNVTARSTDTLTISAAIEGTTDVNLLVGDTIEMRPTALAITELQAAIESLEDLGATNGQVVLSSDFAITTDSTWEDVGLSVALPSAGTYLITYNVRSTIVVTGAGGWIQVQLADGAGTALADTVRMCVREQPGREDVVDAQAAYTAPVSVAGATTVKLQALRFPVDGTTGWDLSTITADDSGKTALAYIRIA